LARRATHDIAVVTGDSAGRPDAARVSLLRMTGLDFTAPAEWRDWWARSAGRLALSGDGHRLVGATL
jgi:hypothetical protein